MNRFKPNIDQYFEEARRQEPVFSFDEARTLIESGAIAHAKIYNIKRAIKPLNVILTTVAAAAAVGIIMFTTSNLNQNHLQNEVAKPSIAMQSGVAKEQTNNQPEKTAISQTITKEEKPKIKELAYLNSKVEENVDNNVAPVKSQKRIDVKGINMIELTSEELCNLGINTDNDGSGYMRFWSNGRQQPQQCELHVNSGLGIIDTWEEDSETKTITTFPKVITDNAGNQRYCLLNDGDAMKLRATCIPSNNGIRNNFNSGLTITSSSHISNQDYRKKNNNFNQMENNVDKLMRINELIAVKVPMGMKIPKDMINPNINMNPNDEFSFILWFDPTPEFVAKLPKRIKDRLSPEIKALEKNPDDLCSPKAIAGEKTYFDVWRSCSCAIEKLSVYPNPARGKINIGFVLKQERNFNIYLHTLTGERIGQLLINGHHSSGLFEGTFQLQNINPGMYLVVIESDKGEQVVQRLIVE